MFLSPSFNPWRRGFLRGSMRNFVKLAFLEAGVKYFTTTQVCSILNLSAARIKAKLAAGHFPGAGACPCGRSYLIPVTDLDKTIRGRKNKKPADHIGAAIKLHSEQ